MAEAALLGVANSVLGQLTSPALKEVFLLWNFDKDVKRLHQTIQTITDFLHDAEQKESKEKLVKEWMSRLRAVLLDADDLFDGVAYRALSKKAMSGHLSKANLLRKKAMSMSDHPTRGKVIRFFSKSNHLAFTIKTAHDIKDIRERLNDIKEDMLPFQFQCLKIEEKVLVREETHSFVDVKTVIGRDEEKEDILSLLLSAETTCQMIESKQLVYNDDRVQTACQMIESNDRVQTACQMIESKLSVVSIIGFGGLGKTTLAQLVYNDDRVQTAFDLLLWVCINYLSDLKSVLVAILTSVLKSTPRDLGLDQLQEKLRESIKGKKFLLVLDDVWDESASNWDVLKQLLVCGKSGSKVLATTRKTKVAQCLDAIEPYYRLQVLSEESAWSLFAKMAFKDGEFSSDSELVPLGQQIVRKCGYVPLALITIGRMLRSKNKDKKVWLSFVDKELPEVLSDDNDNHKVMQALKVSYNDLPPALKHCFAYCSLFPKDHRFDKDELVHMWIAQGFIEPSGKKSLEEVGDECFFHMIDRCFFQEVEERTHIEDGYITGYTCKMHDLLHDLAIRVAGTESRCFIEEDLEGLVEGSALRHISVTCDPNFLSENSVLSSHSKKLRTFSQKKKKKKLRTLLLDSAAELKTSSWNSFFECFNTLRVLRLPDLDAAMLPDSFGGLIHLRYLDLSNSRKLKKIPKSICKLHHLQTLNLYNCFSLVELPSNLRKLVSLRHLLLKGCLRLDSLPSGLAEITTLVTLDRLIVHHRDGELRYLGRLDDLCGVVKIQLPVKGWSNCIEDATNSNMFNKKKLKGMIIRSARGEHELAKEEAQAMVEALRSHENLEYLKIEGYIGDKLPSWVFSLSDLKQLILEDCPNLEYLDHGMVKFESVFPCLEILEMGSLPNLKGWWRGAGAPEENACMSLSRVSKVSIKYCRKLVGSMPSIGESIEDLSLHRVDGKVLSKLFSRPNMGCSSNCHPYNKLKEISLCFVRDLNCLPENLMKCFSALKSLEIRDCEELRWVSGRGLAHLTALEELEISVWGSVKLEDANEEIQVGMPWRYLQRLRKLEVPWQRHLQGGLQYLTALEELEIGYYESGQVEADNEDVQVRGALWTCLDNLQTLAIDYEGISPQKEHSRVEFPKWIQYLCSVSTLTFKECKELRMSWTILANMKLLRSVNFIKVEKVVNVNVDEMVTEQQTISNSLLTLNIFKSELNASWINDVPWKLFPSLRGLKLINMDLSRIPDGFKHLTSLRELRIECCSEELGKRCEPERGEDWRLISHIPYIYIYWCYNDGNWQAIDVKP